MLVTPQPNLSIEVVDWGTIDYREAFLRQEEMVAKIISGDEPEKIVFCTHPPIVTLGRGTKPGDVFSWAGDTMEVNRGGRATYHGPSQMILYPLIYIGGNDERFAPKALPAKDLHQYMRCLEESAIETLHEFGIESSGRSRQTQVGEADAEEATGVWVDNRKVASIGIAVRKWVTSHGMALNLDEDNSAFQGMNPCGFRTEQMTSVEALLGEKVDRLEFKKWWCSHFLSKLLGDHAVRGRA